MKNFENICKMSQGKLKAYLTKYLKRHYNYVKSSDGFLYAKGTFPVLLVAHMDTVHKDAVQQVIYEGNIISSPQGIGGDDRCGIAMILEILKTYNCSVLFTEDEEIGCVGATKFVKEYEKGNIDMPRINYIIELDRKGSTDAVFYQCDNPDFTDFILQDEEWELEYGSYTDIVEISPILGVAAVNFSCGYYNAHTTKEYVNLDEMEASVEKVKKLLARTTDNDYFEYIEAKYQYNKFWSSADDEEIYYISAYGQKGNYIEDEVYATSEAEAIGYFLIDNDDVCFNDIIDVIRE